MTVENIEVKADPEVIAAWQSHFAGEVELEPNWLTCNELAEIAGLKRSAMRIRIRKGLDRGEYEQRVGYRKRSDGRRVEVPVYKLVGGKRGRRTKS